MNEITVIIPMFNAEKTIKGALDSVKNQTYPVKEIIVINDGSTDFSEQIVKNYIINNPTLIIKFINKVNEGVSIARNEGMRFADSDWIALLDADDEWHPKKVEIVSQFFDSGSYLITHGFTLNNEVQITAENLSIVNISYLSLLFKNYFVTPSVVIKNDKDYFFDDSMRYAEDHDLWLRIAQKKKILFIDLPLVKLGRTPLSVGGASGNIWKMRMGEIKMYRKFFFRKFYLIPIFPLFALFSITKHLKRKLFKN